MGRRNLSEELFRLQNCIRSRHGILSESPVLSRPHAHMQELGWKRSDVVLSTKIFWGGKGPNDKGLSRKHIIEGTKARPVPCPQCAHLLGSQRLPELCTLEP